MNAIIYSVACNKKFILDSGFFIIFFFSVSYLIVLGLYKPIGLNTLYIYLVGPIAAYIVGQIFISYSYKSLQSTILIMTLGNFFHGILNIFYNIDTYGFSYFFSGQRLFLDIWTRDIYTATLQGTFYTLIASHLFYSLVIRKENLTISNLYIVMIGIAILISILMGNRTLLIIVMTVFIGSYLVYFWLEKKRVMKMRLFIYLIGLISIIYLLYAVNIFGLKTIVEKSLFLQRLSNSDIKSNPRFTAYMLALRQMFVYPMGGYKMYLGGVSYAHNLWLDVLYATGIIPFIFLILFSISVLINLYKVMKINALPISFRLLMFGIYAGYLLNFMVEPILEGVPQMFLSFCLISGMLSKFYVFQKNISIETRNRVI
jgi:hypothetical protein